MPNNQPSTKQQQKESKQTGLPASCWTIWHTIALGVFVAVVVWVSVRQDIGLRFTWSVLAVLLVAFALVAGHGIKGVWRGVFIDERNMISLSRVQMLAWTVVVLSAYGALALTRVHFDPSTALDVVIPQEMWLLIGISTTSLIGSPLIKSTKKKASRALDSGKEKESLDSQRVGLSDEVKVEGSIVSKKTVNDASWSDLFTGEEVTNVAHLDLAKIQMFFFTVLLVFSYIVTILSLFATACGIEELTALAAQLGTTGSTTLTGSECWKPDSLPALSNGALALVGISHGGYLVNKIVPATS